MEKDGLLTHSNGILNVTEMGKMFVRNIATEFDFHRKNKQGKQFSQSV
jgi:coproporphyrinogen III oxidase-like Fe-S oxidoreductase